MKKFVALVSTISLSASSVASLLPKQMTKLSKIDKSQGPIKKIIKTYEYSYDLSSFYLDISKDGKGTYNMNNEPLEPLINKIKQEFKNKGWSDYKLINIESFISNLDTNPKQKTMFEKVNDLLKDDNLKVERQYLDVDKDDSGLDDAYYFSIRADFKTNNQVPNQVKGVKLSSFPNYRPYRLKDFLKLFTNKLTFEIDTQIYMDHTDEKMEAPIVLKYEGIVWYAEQIIDKFKDNFGGILQETLNYINSKLKINLEKIDKEVNIYEANYDKNSDKFSKGSKLPPLTKLDPSIYPYFYCAITSKDEAIGTFYMLLKNYNK